jgi:hypothetical protein
MKPKSQLSLVVLATLMRTKKRSFDLSYNSFKKSGTNFIIVYLRK